MPVPDDIRREHQQATLDSQANLALLKRIEAEAAITIATDKAHGAPPCISDLWELKWARDMQAKLLPIMEKLGIPEQHIEPAPKPSATVLEFPA